MMSKSVREQKYGIFLFRIGFLWQICGEKYQWTNLYIWRPMEIPSSPFCERDFFGERIISGWKLVLRGLLVFNNLIFQYAAVRKVQAADGKTMEIFVGGKHRCRYLFLWDTSIGSKWERRFSVSSLMIRLSRKRCSAVTAFLKVSSDCVVVCWGTGFNSCLLRMRSREKSDNVSSFGRSDQSAVW